MEPIYFDNAATSWPKPDVMMEAMARYNSSIGGSPGRSGHRLSVDAARLVFDTRESLARLFGIDDPQQIVLTKNATEALNIAVGGLLKEGDHVITSSMEHNSLMRPLRAMEARGVKLSVIPCSPRGELDVADVRSSITTATGAVFLTHASNVTGTIMPIADIGAWAHEQGLLFCVDAAQTAGVVPIDVEAMHIDMLAFTGHKSLYGPQGTGGLFIRKGVEQHIDPLSRGGTGSASEYEAQPSFMPDKYESGTLNTIGITALGATVRYIEDIGLDAIRTREQRLTQTFIDGMTAIEGVTIYGTDGAQDRTAVVSFTIAGVSPSETALILDEEFSIMERPGLHCAPAAHRTMGTFPEGTNRFSFGYFTTENQIKTALAAIATIAARHRR